MNQSLRERVMALPTCWPMGVIARSVPSVNRPMPSISSAAPITNPMSASLETGTTAKHNKNTSPVIGRTDVSASRHFSRSILRLRLGISSILSLGRPRLSDHGYSFNSIILRGVLSIECAVKCSGKNIRPHRHTPVSYTQLTSFSKDGECFINLVLHDDVRQSKGSLFSA